MDIKFDTQPDVTPEPAAAPAAPTPIPAQTPTEAETSQLPARQTNSFFLGDTVPEFKDIMLPRVNLVQNIGTLKDTHPPGALVFGVGTGGGTRLWWPAVINKQTGNVATAAPDPVVMTVLGFRPTRFVEMVPGGGKGLIVNSEKDVVAAGGTLDYNEWTLKKAAGMKRFTPLAEALVAIERPSHLPDDDTVFVYPADGKKYALGLFGLKGTLYTGLAKRVFFTQRATGCLRAGYPTYSFHITATENTFGTNKSWVPTAIPNKKSTEAFLEFVKQTLNPPEAPSEE